MAFGAEDLIGAWSLQSSTNFRDGVGSPTFGEPPAGQIQYTADGRMGAFLMDPAWAANGLVEASSFTEFFSYAGRWELTGDQVRHFIEFSSIPTKVGTDFVRTVSVIDADTIELTTKPETSKSGAVYITKLVWRRHAAI
jgi:hypothetical protein